MNYAWGDSELLADLLGIETPNHPIAEQWFGTHKTAPSKVLDEANSNLDSRYGELGYLVKFLAAAKPLSIQAHPSKSHAQMQFAKGHKSYSDDNHKPELIVAITEFRALCGFRPKTELAADLALLAEAAESFAGLRDAFEAAGYQAAMQWIYEAHPDLVLQLVAHATVLGRKRARLLEQLFSEHGADPGLLVSVLMNHVTLEPNQALFLPAGNIHAYLSGLGVEVMASSDNVLRGGLTNKHIDVRELLKVLEYQPLEQPLIQVKQLLNGLWEYPTSAADFRVYRVEPSASNLLIDLELPNTAIALCTQGEITLSTSKSETMTLKRGEAAFLADSRLFSVTGSGTGFIALG
jgi:mannose-6-phosphate isomerase